MANQGEESVPPTDLHDVDRKRQKLLHDQQVAKKMLPEFVVERERLLRGEFDGEVNCALLGIPNDRESIRRFLLEDVDRWIDGLKEAAVSGFVSFDDILAELDALQPTAELQADPVFHVCKS